MTDSFQNTVNMTEETAMDKEYVRFSDEQLKFLSLFYAFEKPLPLDVAEKLFPIPLTSFLELLGRDKYPALIMEVEENLFRISPDLPKQITDRLEAMNDKDRLSDIIDRLIDLNIVNEIDPGGVSGLFVKSGRIEDIAEIEFNRARKALEKGDQHRAMHHLWNVVKQPYKILENPKHKRIFISATMKLSDLCFLLGSGFVELPKFLKKARSMALQLGDRRSHALINLNLSIFLHISHQHEESLITLNAGLKEVEELGDEDILNRSAAFVGLSYFLKGMFIEAEPYLERATSDFEHQGIESMTLGSFPMPFLRGWCVAKLGYFQDAVGGLERSRRLARVKSQDSLATTILVVLGAVLQMAGNYKVAAYHLEPARAEALEARNKFALALVEDSLILQSFMEGRIEDTCKKLDRASSFGSSNGFPRLYTASYILEMIFEMESLGLSINPQMSLENQISWIQKAPNIHAKGIAYRIMAKKAFRNKEPIKVICTHLENSERLLNQSGDPIELAKTQLETVRLKILENKKQQAAQLAENAFETLATHDLEFIFPGDLKYLLKKQNKAEEIRREYQYFLNQGLKIFEFKANSESVNQIFTRMLKFACRLLKAERGGIFCLDVSGHDRRLLLQAGYNLTEFDIFKEDFASGMTAIKNAIRRSTAVTFSFEPDENAAERPFIREIMCLPMKKQGKIYNVFYFDNTYLKNRFHLIDKKMMVHLSKFIDGYIEQLIDYNQLKKETSIRSLAQSSQIQQMQREEFVFQSQVMIRLLAEAEQIAATDTTILIQGETGVGKEVLSRQIHHMSPRKIGPFEVVDLTSIPESLLESELFGYEKGAFTGADQQKRGRIELAHKGTLLLDEIGEIPLSFQVKLLRLLQEKTFVRVGGTRTLISDFRLIAATNRELEKEVSKGRFRQDLFYRLNMMPILVPPLRERKEDIVLLAKHFLSRYAVKHNKEGLKIRPNDITLLIGYHWPGNVRELKNVMERASLLSKNGKLDFSQLKSRGSKQFKSTRINTDADDAGVNGLFNDIQSLEDLERQHIQNVLDQTHGKIGGPSGAGDLLGIKRTTLYAKMRKLGIRPKHRF